MEKVLKKKARKSRTAAHRKINRFLETGSKCYLFDGFDKNEVESVITITHNKDGTFDVLSNGVQIGWFKLMPHESFLCFSGKGIYDNTQKKGFREMMKYFEDLSKEKA